MHSSNDRLSTSTIPSLAESRSKSQPLLTSQRRGSYFGAIATTTPEQRREIAKQKSKSLHIHKQTASNKRHQKSLPISKLKPKIAVVQFIATSNKKGPYIISANLEKEIEDELFKKDAEFVLHRRELLDGPKISAATPIKVKRKKRKSKSPKGPTTILNIDAERLNIKCLSRKAISKETDKVFLSPLISYVVQDPSYTLSPARQHKLKHKNKRPSSAGIHRSTKHSNHSLKSSFSESKESKESKQANVTATANLLRMIRSLKVERDSWKERFRKEAQGRSTICTLDNQLQIERKKREQTEVYLNTQIKKQTNLLTRQLKELKTSEEKAVRESKEWRLRYSSEALFQVNTALECQVVNCGYRRLALNHKQQISSLKNKTEHLLKRIASLVKEAEEHVLSAVLSPNEQPKCMSSGFVPPLSLSSLPPVEAMRKRGGGKGP